ncbi:MAG: alpha/beta hydrolase domain-containing protein, partial [Bryobacteraceae bacterium]|nr:alpha/beta hydrolase domain-containing protein [Bryobacteraceae bacterium]
WGPWEDKIRKLPLSSLMARCTASKTCPKVFDMFGSAEIWGLRYGPGLTGTSNQADLRLPANVRRYFVASTSHGSGPGGFDTSLPGVGLPATGMTCSGNNFGVGILPRNPMPQNDTESALVVHFRSWIMKGTEPPASRYPRMSDGTLVANTKEAMGFPTLPQLPPWAPSGLAKPLFDYDWGPEFQAVDGSGVPTKVPPAIRAVVPSMVPKVDADGNELGGVPVVLRDAPLGTYLGWNIVSGGFYKDNMCGYTGGMIPFARTRAERERTGDPRLSLEERYRDHDGYVKAVRAAAGGAVAAGFLLPDDAEALIAAAGVSKVLVP